MREGRRQRLGLQEGTEGTVQDTYLDRIITDAEVAESAAGPFDYLNLGDDANVNVRDQRYVGDAYKFYLDGGFPEEAEPVIDTPVVDTTPVVDAGGGGGGQDLVTGDLDLGGNTDFEQDLIDQGIGVQGAIGDPVVAPGEIPVTQQEMDDFNAIPVTQPMTGGITGDDIEVGIPDSETDFVDPLGTISGAPIISQQLQDQGPTTVDFSTGEMLDADAQDIGNIYDEVALTGQQGLIDQAFSKVGSTAGDIMNDLSKIPGAVADYANQTVDILGKKINVGKTLLGAGINKIVGGPISLVFDAAKAVAGMLPEGIEATTDKARETGLLQGDNTVTQDIYGINTQSMFGDYNQYNIDRVEQLEAKVNKTPRDITELQQRKDYIDSSGALGDINLEGTGDASVAEDIALQDRIDAGIAAADEEPAPSGDGPQGVDAGTADIQDFADIYEPPAPSYSPPSYSGQGGQGGGGGTNIGGGQQTSSGGPGGFSSGSGGWGWAKGGIVSLKNAKR